IIEQIVAGREGMGVKTTAGSYKHLTPPATPKEGGNLGGPGSLKKKKKKKRKKQRKKQHGGRRKSQMRIRDRQSAKPQGVTD
ncbi:hypothetical protein, partial [Aeromonas salmonicida]|uniref:hypothetical protein n=1 Tax=Aeromonas salmonicida TaxID=645 RepID=UPI003D3244C0